MSKKIIASSFFLLLFSFSAAVIPCAALTNDPLENLNKTAEITVLDRSAGSQEDFVQTLIGRLIGTILSFVGVIFLILTIYAGITWMLARGNDQEVTKAKNLLTDSIIGLIIVFAAYAITVFIGNFVSSI